MIKNYFYMRFMSLNNMQKIFVLLVLVANLLSAQEPLPQDKLNQQLLSFVPVPMRQPGAAQELEDLLSKGADPNYFVNPYRRETLLEKLCHDDKYNGHIKVLISHCQQTHRVLRMGEALHKTVCCYASISNLTALLEAGADPNALTDNYNTPLQLLILYSTDSYGKIMRESPEWPTRLQMAKLLIDKGARMDIVPANKKIGDICSPIQLAMNKNFPEFVELFRKKIAESDRHKLHTLKTRHSDTYVALLPMELLQEISYMMSNGEFEAQKMGRP